MLSQQLSVSCITVIVDFSPDYGNNDTISSFDYNNVVAADS